MKSSLKTVLVSHRRMNHATVNDSHQLQYYSPEDFLDMATYSHATEIECVHGDRGDDRTDVMDLCEFDMRISEKQMASYKRVLKHLRNGNSSHQFDSETRRKLIVTLRYLITKENKWIDLLFKIALDGLNDTSLIEASTTFTRNFQNRCWAFDQLCSNFGQDVVHRMFSSLKAKSSKHKPSLH